jgi:hypothetical protein
VDVLPTRRDLYFRSQVSSLQNSRSPKQTRHSRPTRKRPHFWGHSSKEAKGRKCQERRCKGPIRQPDRLRVRSRERRVKVKRGLFSYLVEKHLPGQNRGSHTTRTARRVSHCKYDSYQGRRYSAWCPGTPSSRAKKCTFLHIGCRTLLRIRGKPKEIRPGRVYELPATVRSLPGRK